MRILVLMKVVPDTYGDRELSLETGLASRTADESVLDEIDERALEVALAYADTDPDAQVVVLAMAPESGQSSLRKALAMGASEAIQVVDDRLIGADILTTAEVLAAAAQRTGFDLIVAGNASTDGSGGAVPAAMAELLGIACTTSLSQVQVTAAKVVGTRATETAVIGIETPLPAVISITEALPDARMANFKGIMAAKKKSIETLSVEDLQIDPEHTDAARSIMIAIRERPPRAAGVKIVDSGDAGMQLADFLVQNRLV